MRITTNPLWSAILLGSLVGLGCEAKTQPGKVPAPSEQITGHDPDDIPITEADVEMPKSYGDGVERVAGYRDVIRDAIKAGTPTKAHRSLDELDIVLRKLPEIARVNGVPRDQWETVNTAAREIRNHFNKIHAAIDAGEKPNYAQEAEGIDQEIDRLKSVTETIKE